MVLSHFTSSRVSVASTSEANSTSEFSDDSSDSQVVEDDIERSFANLTLTNQSSSSSGAETPSSSSESERVPGFFRRLVSGARSITGNVRMEIHEGYVSDTTSHSSTGDDLDEPALAPILSHTSARTRLDGDLSNSATNAELATRDYSTQSYGRGGDGGESGGDGGESGGNNGEGSKPKPSSGGFGSRPEVLASASAFLGSTRTTSTEYKLVSFLVDNDKALNKQKNLELLIRVAVSCAHGGRVRYKQLPDADRAFSTFRKVTSAKNCLNVTMLCLLGHYLLRSFHVSGDSVDAVYQRLPRCAELVSRTRSNIGGHHIWAEHRFQRNISEIKWMILEDKSRIPYSTDFGLLLVNLVGLNLSLD